MLLPFIAKYLNASLDQSIRQLQFLYMNNVTLDICDIIIDYQGLTVSHSQSDVLPYMKYNKINGASKSILSCAFYSILFILYEHDHIENSCLQSKSMCQVKNW